MNPIRKINTTEVTIAPDGQQRVTRIEQKEISQSQQGSIDTSNIVQNHFHDCGCSGLRPVGGYCYQCKRISCESCHRTCERCRKPICPEHSKTFESEKTGQITLCGNCHNEVSRKQLWGKVRRLVFGFFVDWEK